MEKNREALRKQGLGLAAISYDTEAVLKHFAGRKNIQFPLLSDPESATIRAYGLLNETVKKDNPFFGIPYPATLIVDRSGTVQHKYFEEDYRERQTLSGVLAKDYGVLPAAMQAEVRAKHVLIRTSASTDVAPTGQRLTLAVEVEIPKGYHLYAPGVEGYHAVEWAMNAVLPVKAQPVAYPKSRILFIQAIDEKVPVYEGKLRLVRDVTIGDDKSVRTVVGTGNELLLEGTLKYQACSETLCYPPETVPLRWPLKLEPHDRERAPAELRRKGLQ